MVRVTQDQTIQQAIQWFERDQQRSIMQWLTRDGPFWDDERAHDPDEYLVCEDSASTRHVVTDCGLGEVAHLHRLGQDHRSVSIVPSVWEFSPLRVEWMTDAGPTHSVDVINYFEEAALDEALRLAPVPLASWDDVEKACRRRCPSLTLPDDCFAPLRPVPYFRSAADRIVELLDTLERFKLCFDETGQRTPEGQAIYQEHFTGAKASFSDSSDREKQEFANELKFPHPDGGPERLTCTWHGKVKTPQIRIHFSWPVRSEAPLYVVYVGPKITKR
jgi:hypothetical protein